VRKLTTFTDPAQASALADILLGQSIDAVLEESDDGVDVWILQDRDVADARETLAAWSDAPDSPRFEEARKQAQGAKDRLRAEVRRRLKTQTDVDRLSRPPRAGPVTVGTLLLAVALTALGVGSLEAAGDAIMSLPDTDRVAWAFIDDLRIETGPTGPYVPFLGAVRDGQIWRLFTPMFVHVGGLFHLLFNGYWVWGFGQQIETRRGPLAMALMVLVFGAFSMTAQYTVGWALLDVEAALRGQAPTYMLGPLYLGGPIAGGLSGALYGLFGYIWAKSSADPFSGLGVSSSTVGMLVVWLVICFTGAVGPVGNVAHASGLAIGVLWGAAGHRLPKPW
jgi:GlpG protein